MDQDNVLQFKIKYVSVVACCKNCEAVWIAHLRESDYRKYLVDKRGICCYCHSQEVSYCRKC